MILKEITLSGFKSFADRTKIDLGPGVTTIVGPNGCGKSNVVDAIRWVLGEQSAKALRGGKMHDVIFAGTDNRPQMADCEVSLLFTDCEKQLGTAFNEVQIIRRVSRDGGSNYYLNGKVSRLKDIQNLFMDTGLGRSSYSFMMQGQIDQILSSNPSERRIIFEEAAGVTRYKAQRREALSKLEQVERNLARVKDVIDEVDRQRSTLKRQASKALRYKRLKHRLDHLDLAHASFHYNEKNEIIQGLEAEVSKLRDTVEALNSTLTTDQELLEDKKIDRAGRYDALQAVQQRVFDLRSQKDQFDNQSEMSLVRQKDSQVRIDEFTKELSSIEKALTDLENQALDDAQVKQLQLNLVDSSGETFSAKTKEVQAVEERLRKLEADMQQKRHDSLKLEGDVNRTRSKSSQLEVQINTNAAKNLDLEEKATELTNEHSELEAKLKELEAQIGIVDESFSEKQKKVLEVENQVNDTISSFREIQSKIQDKDREVAKSNAQVSILEGMQAKLEGFSDGAKAILKGKLSSVIEKEQYHVLAEGVEVKPGFESSFETLVGQAIDGIALDQIAQVAPIFDELASNKHGRACLQVDVGSTKKPSKSLPEFLSPARDAVTIKDKNLAKRWDRVLDQCYFTESLEQLLEYWEGNPTFSFLFIATKSGELIDGRGLIYGGSSGKKRGGANYIEREKELRKLKETLETDKENLEKVSQEAASMKSKLSALEELLAAEKQDLDLDKGRQSELRVEERSLKSSLERNIQLKTRVARQKEELSGAHGSSEAQLKSAQDAVTELTAQLEASRNGLSQMEEAIAEVRTERDKRREELSELRVELAEKKQRLTMIDQGLSEIDRRKQGLTHRREQRTRDLNQTKEKVVTLGREAEEYKLRADESRKSMDVEIGNLEVERKALMVIEEAIKEIDQRLTEKRKGVHEQEVILKNKEVQLTKDTSQFNFIVEKIRLEHDIEVETIDWKDELWEADEEFETRVNMDDLDDEEDIAPKAKQERGYPTDEDLKAMENTDWPEIAKEIKQLREKISSMGAVNLVAIEEYSQLKERFEFLTAQCNDLTMSKEQLVTAIEDINKKSQEMFVETFNKVRDNFRVTFEKLFGGGYADLELSDSEDILDAGVEITARPPGTKLKNLTLLSGGQKTMTAVALLFAIYQVKPSPFCVLDELDAPLDDANIGRFVTMLKEFTAYSQFLVISHNKRTISESNTLYGVTMEERGVTKLLSMRFNNREENSAEVENRLAELVEA